MNLVGKDAKLFRGYFKEMAKLRGLPGCQYQYIKDTLTEDPSGNYVYIDGVLTECSSSDYPHLTHYSKSSTKRFTIHGELRASYSDPEQIYLIFQEHPNMKTLRAVGWASESNTEGDKPYIVQLPFDTPQLQVGCRVLIPFSLHDEQPVRKTFRITKVAVIALYPDCYTCTIAPEFETDPSRTSPSYSNTNSNFMRNFK